MFCQKKESLKTSFKIDLSQENIKAMEVDKDSSSVGECIEETSVSPLGSPFLEEAYHKLLKIPVCEFRKALTKAFAILSQNIELDLKDDKEYSFNENFDVFSVRQTFYELFKVQVYEFHEALINALIILAEKLQLGLKSSKEKTISPSVLNILVFFMEIPMMQYLDYLEETLPAFCKAASYLSVGSCATLARTWSTYQPDHLRELLNMLHQLISHEVIHGRFTREYCIDNKDMLNGVAKLMKIIYYASLLGGEVEDQELTGENNELGEEDENQESPDEDNELREEGEDNELGEEDEENELGEEDEEQEAIGEGDELGEDQEPTGDGDEMGEDYEDEELTYEDNELVEIINLFELFHYRFSFAWKRNSMLLKDPLSVELNIKTMGCWKPLLPFSDFHHELFSKQLETDRNFAFVRELTFILTPEVKALGLYFDNRIRMHSVLQPGAPDNSFLKLWVRRDNLIDDTLVWLKMVAMESPRYLKKKLVVEFDGEQGVDDGGLSKEFFQLIVEEIFNPDFAMFILNPETQTYWFNPTTFENEEQFVLIGIILGLAIYNNVILDIHFPMVLYRKLMGKNGTFYDLRDWNPSLWKGLNDLLSYSGDDLEDVFMQSFCITYTDVFGTVLTHNLKEGDNLSVDQDNKKEFVRLYSDFLLNKSISKQFLAFKKGFRMVTKDSLLGTLFRPEELELIICGEKNFDFNALERATKYDGGYWSDSAIIKWFWESVHDFTLDQKRKLLQFTTGSDRIPVGGLSKLKFVIMRNGGDAERLPTAHTCVNVLLLPEYATKEKLKDRLLKAINYSKGFGLF